MKLPRYLLLLLLPIAITPSLVWTCVRLQLWPCLTCRPLSTPLTILHQLSDWYRISGQAQIWFSSYLQNRHQSVQIKDTLSDKVTRSYGVPQGSVLGPVTFTLYTTPLRVISSSFHVNLYADDTQIYMSLSVSNAKESLEKLQHCVGLMAVSAWMTGSKLKLNPRKNVFSLGPHFSENNS